MSRHTEHYRRFATVERRAKVAGGKNYVPIPSDAELAVAVYSLSVEPDYQQVGWVGVAASDLFRQESSFSFIQYSSERDGCSVDHQYPVVELLRGQLWPVLLITKVLINITSMYDTLVCHWLKLSPHMPDLPVNL